MRRYSLQLSEEFWKISPREAVETAFDSEGELAFIGESERVQVSLEGSVTMYRRQRGTRRILEFSGVITEGERPYFASVDEDQAPPPYFTLDVEERARHA